MSVGARVRVASVSEIPVGSSKRVRAGKWDISVFNAEGVFYAVKDGCPHQMVSLCGGPIAGSVLTCPGHAWRFDLRDGSCVEGDLEMTLKKFPVVEVGGELFVEV